MPKKMMVVVTRKTIKRVTKMTMMEKIPLLLIVLMMMETTVTITIMRLKRMAKMWMKEEPLILENLTMIRMR